MLRVTTKVTSSPTASRRTRSASAASSSQFRAVRVQQGQRLVVGERGGVVLGAAQRGADLGVEAAGRAGAERGPGDALAQPRPVAVDGVEVAAPVAAAALGVHLHVQFGAARRGHARLGLLPGASGDDGVGARQAGGGVGERGHVAQQPGVDPRFALPHVLGVDGEALAEREARLGGAFGERVDLRPGAFGVDVVGGERRDAAPVVDPGAQHQRELAARAVSGVAPLGDEVGRGLDAGLRSQHDAGDGDGGGQVLQFGVGPVAHRGVGLGPEVLHDDLLDRAVLAGRPADGEDRVGALGGGLADADEDSGGEGNTGASGVLQDAQPHRGVLVGAAVVDLAAFGEQPRGGGLQHHAHGRGDGLEALEVAPGQHAGVEVRQQARLLQDHDGHGAHVGEGVVVALLVEPPAGLRPAVLGAVAEGEQRLLAAQGGSLPGDREDLVRGQVGGGQLRGGRGEGAVVTAVPAQSGQRDEDLAAVGDDAGTSGRGQSGVADAGGVVEQGLQVVAPGVQQDLGLGRVQRFAVPDAGQRAPHGRSGGDTLPVSRTTHGRTIRPRPPASGDWSGCVPLCLARRRRSCHICDHGCRSGGRCHRLRARSSTMLPRVLGWRRSLSATRGISGAAALKPIRPPWADSVR
ncbi:hypothetical protein ABH917_004779 [Thermobifida halotolerans]